MTHWAVVKGQGIASWPRSVTAKGTLSRTDAPWPFTAAQHSRSAHA